MRHFDLKRWQREHGGANWALIICIVLLLVVVFLWYDTKGRLDAAEDAKKKADADVEAMNAQVADREGRLDALSEVVGFRQDTSGGGGHAWTDVAKLKAQLSPEGAGFLADLRNKSFIDIDPALYKRRANEPEGKAVAEIQQLPQAFKDKLKEVQEARPKDAPTPATPEDDPAEQERAAQEMKAYHEKMADYAKKMEELLAMKEWPVYSRTIAATALWDPDRINPWRVTYFQNVPSAAVTVEEALKLPAPVIDNLRESFAENMKANATTITQKNDQIATLEKSGAEKDTNLSTEQAAHNTDVTKLQGDVSAANAKAEEQRVKATQAEQALAQAADAAKAEKKKLETSISALGERVRADKEHRDFVIARNDPDGHVLDASATLGTAAIDIGSADKVFPGLKFEVSYIGRGGIRQTKGTVVVIQVIDAHYSKVRIEQQISDEQPIGRGDLIANPFFDAKKPIHVYIAGDLRKYPRRIAEKRLAEMNVIIDAQLSTSTDYIVVPASLTAPAASATPPPEGAPAPTGKSEYETLASQAKTFGADMITERTLEAFLDY